MPRRTCLRILFQFQSGPQQDNSLAGDAENVDDPDIEAKQEKRNVDANQNSPH